jgi:hypothetical protein
VVSALSTVPLLTASSTSAQAAMLTRLPMEPLPVMTTAASLETLSTVALVFESA